MASCFGVEKEAARTARCRPAVDLDDLTRNVRGEVGGEEHGHVGNVLGLAAAAEGNLRRPFLAHVVGKSRRHGCFNEARSNGVGTDAARTHLLRNRLGQSNQTGLRSGVIALPGVAVYAHNRRHVDDGAAALAHHDGRAGVNEIEGRLQVHGNDCIPLLLGHTHHESVLRDAGVVHQDVDRAELFLNPGHYVGRLGKVGCVRGISHAFHAFGCYFCLGSLAVLVDDKVGKSDVSAFFGELQRDGLADATGGTRDEGGLSC